MALRDNSIRLFEPADAGLPDKRNTRRRRLARRCWLECPDSQMDDGSPELLSVNIETCPHCLGRARLTAIRADDDLIGRLLAKEDRLRFIIRAKIQAKRERG